MGLGDEIMATAEVSSAHGAFPDHQIVLGHQVINWAKEKVKLVEPNRGLWKEERGLVFRNNPKVTPAQKIDWGKKIHFLKNYAGKRPYTENIEAGNRGYNFVWDYKASPGEIFFDDEEKAKIEQLKEKYSDHILINPAVKNGLCRRNKDWGAKKWNKLSRALANKGYDLVQSNHGNAGVKQELRLNESTTNPILDSVKPIHTYGFRDMMMLISSVRSIVTTEGSAHHAAAALGKKAVVIFGGRVPPSILGYDFHTNFFIDEVELNGKRVKSPCGLHEPCAHCEECMRQIKLNDVLSAVLDISH